MRVKGRAREGKGKIDHKHFTLINQILFNVHKDAFCKRQGSKDVIIYRVMFGGKFIAKRLVRCFHENCVIMEILPIKYNSGI